MYKLDMKSGSFVALVFHKSRMDIYRAICIPKMVMGNLKEL